MMEPLGMVEGLPVLGLRYRILNISHKNELEWSLWVTRLSGAEL